MSKQENVAANFQEYLNEVTRGKKSCELIYLGSKGPIYRSAEFSGPISFAVSCIWDGKGKVSCHEWSEGRSSEKTREITAILKKRKKMILSDKDIGYGTFGAEKIAGEDVVRAVLYLRCGGIVTFITASSDLPTVQVIDYVLEDTEDDPLQVVLHDLLSHMQNHAQEKEAADNAAAD